MEKYLHRVVGLYVSRQDASLVVARLDSVGVPASKIRVIEPDIREAPQQSAATTRHIGELIRNWRQTWSDRDRLKAEALAKTGDVWTRERSIYYDDSQIMEQQRETIHYCRHCNGVLTISTESGGSRSRGNTAFAAVVGPESCPGCRAQAKEAVVGAKRQGRHRHYILQDRREDTTERL